MQSQTWALRYYHPGTPGQGYRLYAVWALRNSIYNFADAIPHIVSRLRGWYYTRPPDSPRITTTNPL